MKILIVGQGGREHALGWKLKVENPRHEIIFAFGNAGTALTGKNVQDTAKSLVEIAKDLRPDLTVIGPETPLAQGLSDDLSAASLKTFGPSRQAAQLEASKIFAKSFMERHHIASAAYRAFDGVPEALRYIENHGAPVVVKADGLAQGKGSVVAASTAEAKAAVLDWMEKKHLGEAGKRVVIEDCLQGQELSVQAFFDGSHYLYLPGARDHKRLTAELSSPMTGGMGVVAPVYPGRALWDSIVKNVLHPFRAGLEKEGIAYRGLIYFGLMLTRQGPKVLEFNVRFGDPETQALMPLLDAPLSEIMQAACEGLLKKFPPELFWKALEIRPRWTVCVTLASPGYPGRAETGNRIEAPKGLFEKTLAPRSNFLIFHAGTARQQQYWVTAGGRVLSCVGVGANNAEARANAYQFEKLIQFPGMQYRKDIGEDHANQAFAQHQKPAGRLG